MRPTYQIHYVVIALTALIAIADVNAHNEHPLGRQPIAWSPDKNILRTLAYNFDFAGGGDFVTWRPPGGIEQRDGHSCLVGPYFFFDVRDEFAFDIDETVTLELLFDRTITEGFNLSYDHAVAPKVISQTFSEKNNDRWQRTTVTLERARLANRKYDKTDFAIGGLKSLFPPDNSGGGHEIALCDIKIRRTGTTMPETASGSVTLIINDEHGKPTPARVAIYHQDGRAPLASSDSLPVRRFTESVRDISLRQVPQHWPSDGRFVFYVDQRYQTTLEPAKYTLIVTKGPEYRMQTQTVVVAAGSDQTLTIELKRWRDMPSKGWYSGDDHIHIGRHDPSGNAEILAYTSAEDIHLANLLQMANVTTWHFSQYAFGKNGQFLRNGHGLAAGQESPRTSHRGHTIGLNAQQFHWPEKDYFLYDHTAEKIHDEGGMYGYAHVAIEGFNVTYGLALDVPLGIVDFVEMLQMGVMNTEYLYDFLNMGFKLLPSAGSDYPYIHHAGAERVYAKIGDTFSVQGWFDAWRSQRSFVTNGPVIEFTVNGDADAQEFNASKGEILIIAATADVNPDFDRIEKLELVVHGKVIASTQAGDANGKFVLNHKLLVDESLWFAIRTYGKTGGKAHTAPVYVYIDNDLHFGSKEVTVNLGLKYIDMLDVFKASRPDLKEEWERFNVEHDVLPKWDIAKPALDQRIGRAKEIYRALIERAQGKSSPL